MATTLRHPFPSCVSIYLFVIVGWDDLLITFPTSPPFVYTSHYTMLILTSSRYYDYATYHAYPFLTLNNLIYHSRLHFDFILLLPHISHQYSFQHSIHWFYIFYGILFLIWLSVYLTNQNWWMQVLYHFDRMISPCYALQVVFIDQGDHLGPVTVTPS